MSLKIIGVSDVSLGFGSTQIPEFMKFLLEHYPQSNGMIIEPDQADKPYIFNRYPQFVIRRIHTHTNCYGNSGRIEYINRAAKIVENEKPDILILFCTFTLPLLFKLKNKPSFVIYYNIEMASAYGKYDQQLNKEIKNSVDLLIYPEKNRANLDEEKYGKNKAESVIVLNCANSENTNNMIDADKRNGRFIYQGTIDKINTNAGYFMGSHLEGYDIDIYGNFAGTEIHSLKEGFAKLNGTVRYYGYVDNRILSEIRKAYAFGIIMWAPVNENQKYAAPNKFFESIADGVVPLATPHPQCKEIIEKYDCGILIKDWSYDAFCEAIEKAAGLYRTKRYGELVENCKTAVTEELNWKIQMKKLKPYLKDL